MKEQILRQCKVQPQAESVGFTSRFSQRHCLFILNRGGGMDKKCLSCPDYIHKQDNADLLDGAFGQSGIWDFKTCHATCWREKDRHNMYMSNRYRYKVGLGVVV